MTSLQTTTEAPPLPAPGVWRVDPAHSSVHFAARHLGLSDVRGMFSIFSAEIEVGDTPDGSRLDAVIDATSINTWFEMRDGHLRSPDFLDVDNFQEIRFVSTSVEESDDRWKVHGDLTIRGATKPAVLDVVYRGQADDPMTQAKRTGFSAHLAIQREDFGIAPGGPMAALVGKTIDVSIEAEAVFDSEGGSSQPW